MLPHAASFHAGSLYSGVPHAASFHSGGNECGHGGEDCAACGVGCGGGPGPGPGVMSYVGSGQGEYVQEQQFRYIGAGGDFEQWRPRRDFTCIITGCCCLSVMVIIPLIAWLLVGSRSTTLPYDCDTGYKTWKTTWSKGRQDFCCSTMGRGCDSDNSDRRGDLECSTGTANSCPPGLVCTSLQMLGGPARLGAPGTCTAPPGPDGAGAECNQGVANACGAGLVCVSPPGAAPGAKGTCSAAGGGGGGGWRRRRRRRSRTWCYVQPRCGQCLRCWSRLRFCSWSSTWCERHLRQGSQSGTCRRRCSMQPRRGQCLRCWSRLQCCSWSSTRC